MIDEPRFGEPPEWTEKAACLGLYPDFDDRGRRKCLTICASCPVNDLCLDLARDLERGMPERYRQGIFGGTTTQERYDMDVSDGIRIKPMNEGVAREALNCIKCGGPMTDTHIASNLYCQACHPARMTNRKTTKEERYAA